LDPKGDESRMKSGESEYRNPGRHTVDRRDHNPTWWQRSILTSVALGGSPS
jgi:hypothetical protein